MSNNYEDFLSAHLTENQVCAVAYTINGDQPTVCTYVGDQPLFYIDEEIIEEEQAEEGYIDLGELGFLADELETLKNEIAELEDRTNYMPEKTLRSYAEFSENAESISECMNFYLNDKEQAKRLVEVKEILSQSRLAAAYLQTFEKYNGLLAMSEQVETILYDRKGCSIIMNPHMDLNDHVLLLARELRRHWQHRQGVLINPMTFAPEKAILINRAQDADLAVSVVRIAWELQLAGQRDVWERVENSPLSDLGRAFAREAFINFRTINDGTAAAAVFEGWFLSERCRGLDKKIIKSMLADYNGYVFENTSSSDHVMVELLSKLGEMPFGKNYLAEHVMAISDDPIFAEVRDRSSANFLWFIKFERSYKETEQELQEDCDQSTQDIRHKLIEEKGQRENATAKSADILQLSEFRKYDATENTEITLQGKNNNGADIIDLMRWSHKG